MRGPASLAPEHLRRLPAALRCQRGVAWPGEQLVEVRGGERGRDQDVVRALRVRRLGVILKDEDAERERDGDGRDLQRARGGRGRRRR
jgi:hypothetical protein